MKICIDAGHNFWGFDTGAVGCGIREQDITFGIADKLNILLKNSGITTVMTREKIDSCLGNSVSSSINERVNISNKNNCDLFVSIHCNAGGGSGCETLIYKKGGKAEKLAAFVNKRVVDKLGLKNRGVKEQNVGVLRMTNCPAILVETAFIDSGFDSLLLIREKDLFANAIFCGICDYLGIESRHDKAGDEKMIYNYIDENMPIWAVETVKKLVDKGFLLGNENGELGLDDTMLRIFVTNDRAGVYDL